MRCCSSQGEKAEKAVALSLSLSWPSPHCVCPLQAEPTGGEAISNRGQADERVRGIPRVAY